MQQANQDAGTEGASHHKAPAMFSPVSIYNCRDENTLIIAVGMI
jgi:hypothetical protein